MPSSSNLYSQIQALRAQQDQMSPVTGTDIQNALLAKVQGYEPQFRELRQAEQQAYAAPASILSQMQEKYGTQGPDAMTRLAYALQDIGGQMGTANVFRDLLNAQQANIKGIGSNVLSAYDANRTDLANRIGQLQNEWQTALQMEEEAKQRAAQESAAAAQQKLLNDQFNQWLSQNTQTIRSTPRGRVTQPATSVVIQTVPNPMERVATALGREAFGQLEKNAPQIAAPIKTASKAINYIASNPYGAAYNVGKSLINAGGGLYSQISNLFKR